jgi:hypothetical protein
MIILPHETSHKLFTLETANICFCEQEFEHMRISTGNLVLAGGWVHGHHRLCHLRRQKDHYSLWNTWNSCKLAKLVHIDKILEMWL